MKNMNLLLTVVALMALPASASDIDDPHYRVETMNAAARSAGFFTIEDPVPVCIGSFNQNTAVSAPPGVPTTPTPPVPQVNPTSPSLRALCAQSNGVVTAFRVETSHPDVGIILLLKTNRHVSVPTAWYADGGVFTGFHRRIYVYSTNVSVYDEVMTQSDPVFNTHFRGGNVREFSIPNEALGADGTGIMWIAAIVNEKASSEYFPAAGVFAAVPSTVTLELSPSTGTRIFNVVGQDSRFSLVALVSTTMSPSQISLFWNSGGDNVTEQFNSLATTGVTPPPLAQVAGMPVVNRFTRRINYATKDVRAQEPWFEVVVVSPKGTAVDRVNFIRQDILELPNQVAPLPGPPTRP